MALATSRERRLLSLWTAHLAANRLRSRGGLTISSGPSKAGLADQDKDEETAEHGFIVRRLRCADQGGFSAPCDLEIPDAFFAMECRFAQREVEITNAKPEVVVNP